MRFYTLKLFFLFCIAGYGQESFKFVNYTTVNGLADNRVLCMTQDSRGFMWFGTSEGLSRFDGNKFENYFADPRTSNSLPDNMITSIYEYKSGHIAFVAGATLYCLNTFTRQFYSPPFAVDKKIYALTKSGKSGYLISCIDSCFILNDQLQIIDTLPTPLIAKGKVAISWYLDKNHILIGHHNEYHVFNRSERRYSQLLSEEDMPLKEKILEFRYYDSTNQLLYFINYFEGIYAYDLSGKLVSIRAVDGHSLPFYNGNISFISPKNDSICWIGSAEGQGLAILNTRTNRSIHLKADPNNPYALVSNSLLTAYTDKEGNEWIGTSNGISKLNGNSFSIKKWDFGDLNNNFPFLSIRKGCDGNFYVARFGYSRIGKIDKENDLFNELAGGQLSPTWSLNNFGKKLIATGAGTQIFTYDPTTKGFSNTSFLAKYFPQSDIVVLAFKHSNGDEWYSGNAGGGFVRVSAKDGSIHQYKKDGPAGSFLVSYYPYHAEDKNGDLWFGVNKSARLLHWNNKTERFNEISFSNISNTVNHVFQGITELLIGNDGKIWVGFDGSGVLKYDPVKNQTIRYTIADGLPSNYIGSMTFDDRGRLWIGTYKGLTCFIPTENKFVNFTRKDGLPDDYFSDRCILFDSSTHQLWIGAASALMRFNPDELLKSASRRFPVYIDAIMVNNDIFIDQNSQFTSLPPAQNNLRFTFIGLDPEGGKNIEYKYMLLGSDKEWISTGTTTAAYNSLSPGDYSFIVRARYKGDTKWMDLRDPFKFTIETPWHMTWWFRTALAIAAILLSWFLIRTYYRNKFLKQKAMMEKEIAIEQERTKMARELHDGLGSMLSGIKHSFAAMTKEFELSDNQELLFHANVEKLNEAIKELRNISHNMASDSLLKYGLENSLRDYCSNASLNSGIPVSFTALNTKDLSIKEDKSIHIFRIIQELFQNIMKHSAARNVVVQISNNNKQLYITVEDDGKGFDMGEIKKQDGIGLKNIEARIKLLKGNPDYKTSPGGGTSVLMTIPCN